jgi:outer membrane biosynthesis protein TonB
MKSTKSVKLKKYGSVYNQYIKAVSSAKTGKLSAKTVKPSVKTTKTAVKTAPKPSPKPAAKPSPKPSPRPSPRPCTIKRNQIVPKASPKAVESSVKNSKKSLNEYQKFMRDESAKARYKNMKGTDRMIIISKEWEKKKRKCKK